MGLVTILPDPIAGDYVVEFDGKIIGRKTSEPEGVRLAQDWAAARQREREAEARQKAAHIVDAENEFIDAFARKIGAEFGDVERLLEIAARRAFAPPQQ